MKNLHYGHCLIGVAAVILLVAPRVKASTSRLPRRRPGLPPDDVRDDEDDDGRPVRRHLTTTIALSTTARKR